MIQVGLSPAELAFMGNAEGLSMQETIVEAERMLRRHDPDWPAHWLRFSGAEETVRRYEELTCDGGYGTLEALRRVSA